MYFYNDTERIRIINRALSDREFFSDIGYDYESIPDELRELSLPVFTPHSLIKKRYKTILDIGCGCGTDIFLLSKRFRSAFICGVDLSYSLLKEGRKIHKLSVFNCSALTLPFKNHSFELIIMNGTFNQIKEKKKLLDEIKRISSNLSGDLIVCDIYKKDSIVEIDEGTAFNINCAFTKDGLLSFFEKSGFKFINAVFADDYTKDLGVFSGLWKVH